MFYKSVWRPLSACKLPVTTYIGDLHSLRCDRFSVVVVKPEQEIMSASDLNSRELWNPDLGDDPSIYIERRCVLLKIKNYILINGMYNCFRYFNLSHYMRV